MTTQPTRSRRTRREDRSAAPILGLLLVLIGVFFFAVQAFAFDWQQISQFGPYLISALGLFLFVLALVVGGQRGETLVVFGSMLTMAGLLILYQDRTGRWASWAYAWALVAPTSIGVGFLIYGFVKGQPELTRRGIRLTAVGLALFLILLVLFEVVFGLSGLLPGLTNYVPAVILISIGALILLGSWIRRR